MLLNHSVQDISTSKGGWELSTPKGTFCAEKILIATGSNSKIWTLLELLGHQIVEAVPSLFTFTISDTRLKSIPGVVAKYVELFVNNSLLTSSGPLLITHTGISAPSVLKLSAYGAIELAKRNYNFDVIINFIAQDFTVCVQTMFTLVLHFCVVLLSIPIFPV